MLATLIAIPVVLVLIVLAVLAYASTRPDSFRLERSILIAAPPAKIHPLIDDFHNWSQWSPFENLDADMKRTYAGAPSGKGATYEWAGANAGAGRMEILETSLERVRIQLDFSKPFKASNTAEYSLVPSGETTQVTWAMYGPAPLITKVMGLFFNMDKTIGPNFEQGLAAMKTAAES
jgi:hypothetical protein